jgi:outer membrane protein OmpA-like peptidoglycan-associated protein
MFDKSISLVFFSCLAVFIQSCKTIEPYKDASLAFENKHFSVSADLYNKKYLAAKTRVEKADFAFRLGESYEKMGKNDDALAWYELAYQNGKRGAGLKYALALKKQERYDDAIKILKEAGSEEGHSSYYSKEMQACKAAAQYLKNAKEVATLGVAVKKLEINSANDDYAPSIIDKKLYFSSDRPSSSEKKASSYEWTKRGYSNLFASDLSPDPSSPEATTSLNTDYNEGGIGFSAKTKEAVFCRCGTSSKTTKREYCALYSAKLNESGSWENIEKIQFDVDTSNYASPFLSEDGQQLFLASDLISGSGGFDLYSMTKNTDGRWSNLTNLANLNSQYNEVFPSVYADTLYFASDVPTGMGGLDIYKAVKMGAKYKNPTNLKAPLNSGADDFGLVFAPNLAKEQKVVNLGFFSSSRKGGQGGDDLYLFTQVPPKAPEVPKKPVLFTVTLQGLTLEKEGLERKNLGGVQLKIVSEDTTFTLLSDKDGKFSSPLKFDRDYKITAVKNPYFTANTTVTTRNLFLDTDNPNLLVETQIALQKIEKDKEIVLENIYYDYDKWNIRPDAIPTLNELTATLQDNPKIKIELSSHTDCRGNDAYNQTLSQKRAESVVQYLISKGIAPERLEAKGYGESNPIALCDCKKCTEEEHQKNRRTAFKVID